jgi:hypothetical protein
MPDGEFTMVENEDPALKVLLSRGCDSPGMRWPGPGEDVLQGL